MPHALFKLSISMVLLSLPYHAFGQGTWTKKADFPLALNLTAGAGLNGNFHVFGGLLGFFQATDAHYMYSSTTDTWTELAPLPSNLTKAQGTAWDGRLYVVGGALSTGDSRNTVFAYDPEVDAWEQKAALALARSLDAAVEFEGKIYAIGSHTKDNELNTAVSMYDPATDTWSEKAPYLIERLASSAFVYDGRIYLTGGTVLCPPCDGLTTVEVYDPAEDAWTLTELELPRPRMGHTTHVSDGKVYFIGGGHGATGDWAEVDILDLATGTWTIGPDFPVPRTFFASATVDGKAYIAGGITAPSSGFERLATVYEFGSRMGPTHIEALGWGAIKALRGW